MEITERRIKWIFFDCANVVQFDSLKHLLELYARRMGEDPKSFSDKLHKVNGHDIWWQYSTGRITETIYWSKLRDNVKSTKIIYDFKNLAFNLSFTKKKTVDIVRKLKEDHKFNLLLLTNHTKEWFDRFKNSKDGKEALKHFDIIINSAEVSLAKPDPRIFELALNRAGARPHEVVYIDDQEKNTNVAEAMGIKSIIFRDSKQLLNELINVGVLS